MGKGDSRNDAPLPAVGRQVDGHVSPKRSQVVKPVYSEFSFKYRIKPAVFDVDKTCMKGHTVVLHKSRVETIGRIPV